MQSERPAASPLDPFVKQVLEFVARDGQFPMSTLNDTCGREFNWLPGFCEVVIAILRTNGLIVAWEWEPGKIHVTARGQQWLAAQEIVQTVPG